MTTQLEQEATEQDGGSRDELHRSEPFVVHRVPG